MSEGSVLNEDNPDLEEQAKDGRSISSSFFIDVQLAIKAEVGISRRAIHREG